MARDGVEALDFIFCEGAFATRSMLDMPKVIMLDLKLPKVDGMEVLRRLKADEAREFRAFRPRRAGARHVLAAVQPAARRAVSTRLPLLR